MAEGEFPVNGIPCACVVVRDHRASMASFARFFGIADWRVQHFEADAMSDARYAGAAMQASWISARGDNGRVAFELVQPTGGESLFDEHLRSRGEGMFGLQAATLEPGELEAALVVAARADITPLQDCRLGEARCVWLDTRARLGALTVLREGELPGETMVDLTAEVKQGQPLPVQKHYHFGIVTGDRDATKASYEQLYGMDQWVEFRIETGVTMSDTTYYGQPVSHAYDNWVGRRDGLGVELIQMRYGDAVYQEMLDTIGDGMHHVFPAVCTPEEFEAGKTWFAEQDMPIIQSGRIDGLMDYFYVDTRRALAGLTIEVVTPLAENWLEVMLPGPAAFVLMGPPVGEAAETERAGVA